MMIMHSVWLPKVQMENSRLHRELQAAKSNHGQADLRRNLNAIQLKQKTDELIAMKNENNSLKLASTQVYPRLNLATTTPVRRTNSKNT